MKVGVLSSLGTHPPTHLLPPSAPCNLMTLNQEEVMPEPLVTAVKRRIQDLPTLFPPVTAP